MVTELPEQVIGFGPPLWRHQEKAKLALSAKPRWIHRWDPRTGKTRLALEEMLVWANQGCRRVLVSTSKNVLADVWSEAVEKTLPKYWQVFHLYEGTLAKRRATIFRVTQEPIVVPQLFLVNHEAMPGLRTFLELLHIDALVLDEVHEFMSPSGARHKVAKALADKTKIVRGLTGTPVSSSYVNVYGIYKVIDESIFGSRIADFNAAYCVYNSKGKVISYINIADLKKRMASISDEIYKRDCFDIPQEFDVFREISLSGKLMAMYKEVAQKHVLNLEDKELTFDHLFARLSWLQQFTGGYLPLREGVGGEWYHSEKVNACKAEVEDIIASGHKVVIVHRFRAEGEAIASALGYHNCARIARETKIEERVRLRHAFNETEYPKALVIQQKIGSVGISLRGADYIIFYSTEASHLLHDQGVERIFKPGADNKLTRIYLTCKGTVDRWFLQIIKKQRNLAEALRSRHDLLRAIFGEVT